MKYVQLPYRSEGDIKRAEWFIDELYARTAHCKVISSGDTILIEYDEKTQLPITGHFLENERVGHL